MISVEAFYSYNEPCANRSYFVNDQFLSPLAFILLNERNDNYLVSIS